MSGVERITHPAPLSLQIEDKQGDLFRLTPAEPGTPRTIAAVLHALDNPKSEMQRDEVAVWLSEEALRRLAEHALYLRRNALDQAAGMLEIIDVLDHDDTELGARVRAAVANGNELTLVIGERERVNVEMPCEVCDKPEPSRDDCATCGDEEGDVVPAPPGAYLSISVATGFHPSVDAEVVRSMTQAAANALGRQTQ